MGIWRGWKDFGSVMFDFAQGHLCFHVLMFLLSIKRHLAGERICRYDFPFLRLKAPLDLQGQTSPSVIVYCTRPVENFFPIMHLIVWATMGHDARRHDDQAALFYYLWLFLKRRMKTRASSRNATSAHWIYRQTEVLIWIGLTMTFSLKSQYWWSMFFEHRRSCMHFIGVCQSIITW